MSQLNNPATKFEIKEKETNKDDVLINIYNTNKDTEEATLQNKKSVDNIKIKKIKSNGNIKLINKRTNDVKEEVVDINLLNSVQKSSNTTTAIVDNNNNAKNFNYINTNTNDTSEQMNISLNDNIINDNIKINTNTDKYFNNENNNNKYDNDYNNYDASFISISSRKSIKFDLNKKERMIENKMDNELEEEKGNDSNKKVSAYCPVCKAKASFMCSSCGPVVFYCSQSCQIAHWPEHRLVCKGVKKRKSIVEHKKTESIFGEMIDPTIGSDIIVGTRNVAQLINLKRSLNENNNRKSLARLLTDNEEDDDENRNPENENDTKNKNLKRNKDKNSDDNIAEAIDNAYSIPVHSNEDNIETGIGIGNATAVKRYSKRNSETIYRRRSSVILEKPTDEEFVEDLKFYIKQIFLIIKPVLLCILLTIIWVKLTNTNYSLVETTPSYVTNRRGYFKGDLSIDSNNNTSKKILISLKDAFSFLFQMILITTVVSALFIFSCVKTLAGLYVVLMLLLLSYFSYMTLYKIISVYNIPFDKLSTIVFIWNVVVVGLAVIFWKGPIKIQQYYLVFVSSLMAYNLSQFGEWTTWIILVLLAIWDLVAVLCPFGPLRLLLKHSEENQQEIPALLYTLMITLMASPSTSPRIKGKTITKAKSDQDIKNGSHNQNQSTVANASSSPNTGARRISTSSISSSTVTITSTRKINPTLTRYPSNSSIASVTRNHAGSVNGGSAILTNKAPSITNYSTGYRPPYLSSQRGSISDDNSSTANLFQDVNTSFESIKRSNSHGSSTSYINMESQNNIINHVISDKNKYKYITGNDPSRKVSPTDVRINRNLNRTGSLGQMFNVNRAGSLNRTGSVTRVGSLSRTSSHGHNFSHHHYHSRNNNISYLSNENVSTFSEDSNYPLIASFSSSSPLIRKRSHRHRHKHSYSNQPQLATSPSMLSISSFGGDDDDDTDIANSSFHSKSHKSKPHHRLGPPGDIFTRVTEEEYQKKKRKIRERRLKKEKEKKEKQRREDEEEEAERNGIKLGLGDFVFYSVLVAEAASQDWMTTVNCTIAVITGLTITIFLLALLKRALPALPLSIFFGILFYFGSKKLISALIELTYNYSLFKNHSLYEIYWSCIKQLREIYGETASSYLTIGKYYMGFIHV